MVFVKENAPHIHRKDSLFRRRLDVLIALLPVVVAAFVFLLVAVIFKSIESIEVYGFTIDLKLAGIIITIFSLWYEVYNFGKIHKLKIDIEEQVLTEKQNTPKQ